MGNYMRRLIWLMVLVPLLSFGQTIREATATGAGTHDGTSVANAWSYAEAFAQATGHMIVNMKAGNDVTNGYNIPNSGLSATQRLHFRGYKTAAGDVVSSNGSTFVRTNTSTFPSSSDMPYLDGPDLAGKYGVIISGSYITVENIQVRDFDWGFISSGLDAKMINAITYSCNSGFLLNRSLNGGVLENSYVLNSGNTGINIQGGKDYTVKYSQVRTDDPASQFPNDPNPLIGYYFATTLGARNNIIENCTAYRIPATGGGTYHQGHGFVGKADSQNNIYRNNTAYNTGIEVNFSDVTNNTFENIKIYGEYTANPGQFSAGIRIINGASGNTFKNIYIEDTRYAFNFHDFDDGYTPSPDTDAIEGGHDNDFINVVVNGMNTLTAYTESPASNAVSSNNTWYNCTFYNSTGGGGLINGQQVVTNENFINCVFDNFDNPYMSDISGNGSLGLTFQYTNFSNNSFTTPTGTNITTHAPSFVGPLTSDVGFKLQSGSLLKDIGKTEVLANSDYEGNSRPAGSSFDLAAFEEGSGGGGDVTAPTESNVTVSNISDTNVDIDFNVDEGSYFHVFYDTNTGSATLSVDENTLVDYPNSGFDYDLSFPTFVLTSLGDCSGCSPLISGTTYFFRIRLEDAAGNVGASSEYSFTTAGSPSEPTPPTLGGVKSRFLKRKKM